MKYYNVLKMVCTAIGTHAGVTVDNAGNGIVEYCNHSFPFEIQYFKEKHTFSVDLNFGIEFNFSSVEAEIFMGVYNSSSTISKLIDSRIPSLRISHCIAGELPSSEFILKLFESALEAWIVLNHGFERIISEKLIFDPMVTPHVEAEEFYEEIVGDKLDGLIL